MTLIIFWNGVSFEKGNWILFSFDGGFYLIFINFKGYFYSCSVLASKCFSGLEGIWTSSCLWHRIVLLKKTIMAQIRLWLDVVWNIENLCSVPDSDIRLSTLFMLILGKSPIFKWIVMEIKCTKNRMKWNCNKKLIVDDVNSNKGSTDCSKLYSHDRASALLHNAIYIVHAKASIIREETSNKISHSSTDLKLSEFIVYL